MKEVELLEKSIAWFRELTDQCDTLTSGNVSHLGMTIRGKAIRCAEFIRKHAEKKTELLELAADWFDGVADSTKKLTTGNVAHHSATIRCLAREAAQYIENEIQNN